MWFLDQLDPDNAAYNIPTAVRLRGYLDRNVIERSLNEIVRRHEVLRTTIANHDGRASQVIAPELTVPVLVEDLTGIGEGERDEIVRQTVSRESRRPFSLTDGPLLESGLCGSPLKITLLFW